METQIRGGIFSTGSTDSKKDTQAQKYASGFAGRTSSSTKICPSKPMFGALTALQGTSSITSGGMTTTSWEIWRMDLRLNTENFKRALW